MAGRRKPKPEFSGLRIIAVSAPVKKIARQSDQANSDYAKHPKFDKFLKKGAE